MPTEMEKIWTAGAKTSDQDKEDGRHGSSFGNRQLRYKSSDNGGGGVAARANERMHKRRRWWQQPLSTAVAALRAVNGGSHLDLLAQDQQLAVAGGAAG